MRLRIDSNPRIQGFENPQRGRVCQWLVRSIEQVAEKDAMAQHRRTEIHLRIGAILRQERMAALNSPVAFGADDSALHCKAGDSSSRRWTDRLDAHVEYHWDALDPTCRVA